MSNVVHLQLMMNPQSAGMKSSADEISRSRTRCSIKVGDSSVYVPLDERLGVRIGVGAKKLPAKSVVHPPAMQKAFQQPHAGYYECGADREAAAASAELW